MSQVTNLECSTFHTSVQAPPLCPTLIDSPLIPELENDFIPALVSQNDSEDSHLPRKGVTFSDKRKLRLFSENTNTFTDIIQVCAKIETEIKSLKPIVYLMSNICGLDHSLKEVFYTAFYTSPIANKIAILEEEFDFYSED